MRKILLFIIISGVLYMPLAAQDVKIGGGVLEFGGKLTSGIFYDADDAAKETTDTHSRINDSYIGEEGRIRMWNETDSKTGLRADLTAAYTHNNFGFKFRFRSDTALEGQDRNTFTRFAFGWLNLLNDGLKFTGGYIDLDSNVWGTLGDLDEDVSGNGLRIEIKPLKFFDIDEENAGSLNIGAFFRVPSKGNDNIGRDEEGRPVYRTVTPGRVFGETALGLRYTHKWFYASAQFEMDSDIDGADVFEGSNTTITEQLKVWSDAGDESRFMFGVGFTMLPQLRFSAEGVFNGLGNWDARGTADLRQTLWYSFSETETPVLNRFKIGIRARELMYGYDLSKHLEAPFDLLVLKPWIQFRPFIEFTVTPEFIAGVEVGYGFGHVVKGSLIPETSNNATIASKDRMFANEKHNISVKPQLWYNFGGGLALTAWYKAAWIGYQDLVDAPQFANLRHHYNGSIPFLPDGTNMHFVDSLFTTQVALEFIVSF